MNGSVHSAATRLVDEVGRVIIGKREAVERIFAALLVEGHVLLDDVPGVGKTTLARAISRCLALEFRRVQCTPDLVPSDITGVSIFDARTARFEFRKGPIFANCLLVDEINRATPRAQSALLEAMQERQVTVDEHTHPLPSPFFVIATQNPIELEGTFPLPEAQLDRFHCRIALGYPDVREEDEVLRTHGASQLSPDSLTAFIDVAMLEALREEVRAVRVSDGVRRYTVELVRATRSAAGVELGASPRAAIALFRAAQAHAAMRGRDYVLPDDVKSEAAAVLAHRIFLGSESQLRGRTPSHVVSEALARTAVPAEQATAAG